MVMSLRTSENTVGLHEVAGLEALRALGAAGDELGALVDALLDVAGDPVDLGLARQRAEHGEVGEGVLGLELGLHLVGGDAARRRPAGWRGHEHAGEGGAGLARVQVGLADAVARRPSRRPRRRGRRAGCWRTCRPARARRASRFSRGGRGDAPCRPGWSR